MEIEFDEQKSLRNFAERGLTFDVAALIFRGVVMEWDDARKDYGERRVIAVGSVDGEIVVVVYTDRGKGRRIISARRANRKERSRWQSYAAN